MSSFSLTRDLLLVDNASLCNVGNTNKRLMNDAISNRFLLLRRQNREIIAHRRCTSFKSYWRIPCEHSDQNKCLKSDKFKVEKSGLMTGDEFVGRQVSKASRRSTATGYQSYRDLLLVAWELFEWLSSLSYQLANRLSSERSGSKRVLSKLLKENREAPRGGGGVLNQVPLSDTKPKKVPFLCLKHTSQTPFSFPSAGEIFAFCLLPWLVSHSNT